MSNVNGKIVSLNSEEGAEARAALEAARNNPDCVFLELSIEDTSPVLTEGFRDEQIIEMDMDALRAQLEQINREEESLTQLLAGVRARRNTTNNLMARKTEIQQNGIRNRSGRSRSRS